LVSTAGIGLAGRQETTMTKHERRQREVILEAIMTRRAVVEERIGALTQELAELDEAHQTVIARLR
jgi:hypothetical protein